MTNRQVIWLIVAALTLFACAQLITSCALIHNNADLFSRVHQKLTAKSTGGRFATMEWRQGYILAHDGKDCIYLALEGGIRATFYTHENGAQANLYGIRGVRHRCDVNAPLIGFMR